VADEGGSLGLLVISVNVSGHVERGGPARINGNLRRCPSESVIIRSRVLREKVRFSSVKTNWERRYLGTIFIGGDYNAI